mgnify:CR=1 FL=1
MIDELAGYMVQPDGQYQSSYSCRSSGTSNKRKPPVRQSGWLPEAAAFYR